MPLKTNFKTLKDIVQSSPNLPTLSADDANVSLGNLTRPHQTHLKHSRPRDRLTHSKHGFSHIYTEDGQRMDREPKEEKKREKVDHQQSRAERTHRGCGDVFWGEDVLQHYQKHKTEVSEPAKQPSQSVDGWSSSKTAH